MSEHEKVAVVEREVAVGVSITANVGGDRQIVLQGFYSKSDSAEGDALMAEMNRRVDVMQAPHEIRTLRTELVQQEAGLANMRRNRQLLAETFAQKQASRVIALDEYERKIAEAEEKARADWTARKEGPYREGNTLAQMKRNAQDLRDKAREEERAQQQEYELTSGEHDMNQGRFEREIAWRKERLAVLEALVAPVATVEGS